jgi:hypothetical protein
MIIDAYSDEGKRIVDEKLKAQKDEILRQFKNHREKVIARLREIQEIAENLIQETNNL